METLASKAEKAASFRCIKNNRASFVKYIEASLGGKLDDSFDNFAPIIFSDESTLLINQYGDRIITKILD